MVEPDIDWHTLARITYVSTILIVEYKEQKDSSVVITTLDMHKQVLTVSIEHL